MIPAPYIFLMPIRYTTKPHKCVGRSAPTVTSVLVEDTGRTSPAPAYQRVWVDAAGKEYFADYGRLIVPCRECGIARYAIPVRGKLNTSKKCDARCTRATGHNCECQCGGKNHGAAHSV